MVANFPYRLIGKNKTKPFVPFNLQVGNIIHNLFKLNIVGPGKKSVTPWQILGHLGYVVSGQFYRVLILSIKGYIYQQLNWVRTICKPWIMDNLTFYFSNICVRGVSWVLPVTGHSWPDNVTGTTSSRSAWNLPGRFAELWEHGNLVPIKFYSPQPLTRGLSQ